MDKTTALNRAWNQIGHSYPAEWQHPPTRPLPEDVIESWLHENWPNCAVRRSIMRRTYEAYVTLWYVLETGDRGVMIAGSAEYGLSPYESFCEMRIAILQHALLPFHSR